MEICLIAPNDGLNDPRARVSRFSLGRAGHEVSLVTSGPSNDESGVISLASRNRNPLVRLALGRGSAADRIERLTELMAKAAIRTRANIFMPTDQRALQAAIRSAKATGGYVARTPRMDDAGDVDLIRVAPRRPDAASPALGFGQFHTDADKRAPYQPETLRHRGRRVVLCYRKSEINPGRYLEVALTRSGVELRVETEGIDLASVDPTTDLVLFVEAPYPALDVTGSTTAPVLFWVHHGEHHLHANLRLADRYQADAVLLAHSWHLAFWFPTRVHRFPFGMAAELLEPGKPLVERRYDVAMVGAGLKAGGQYTRRQQLVTTLEQAIPSERLAFREAVSAREMAGLYGDSRIVINEGGTRHYPITMRVFEAVGSGAVLLSNHLPGMEMLLDPSEQFREFSDDVAGDVDRILQDLESAQNMVDSALETAKGLHTYDHRVDELFAIADQTDKRIIVRREPTSDLAVVIDRDVEVQRVAQWNVSDLGDQLPDREVWDATTLSPQRLEPGKMEAVAIRSGDTDGWQSLMSAARRYVYLEGSNRQVGNYLKDRSPTPKIEQIGDITKIDYLAPSYRIMDFEASAE